MRSRTRKPKSVFRRLERVLVGFVMAFVALVLEKLVMRALKKKGRRHGTPAETKQITTRGGAIEFDPEP